MSTVDNGAIRRFDSGATRDTSQQKLDPFGFISPVAMHRFSEYMHKHRLQSDGNLRDSDNWKKGMPKEEYVRSLIRHVMDFWLVASGEAPRYDTKVTDPDEIACAIMFNIQGYLHEQGTARTQLPLNSEWTRIKSLGLIGTLANVNKGLSDDVDRAFSAITNGASDEDWRQERAW